PDELDLAVEDLSARRDSVRLIDERGRVGIDRRLEQPFIAGEVGVDRRGREAGVAGDVGDGGSPVPLGGKATDRETEQAVPGAFALRLERARLLVLLWLPMLPQHGRSIP